ncbi:MULTISPECIES: ATP/GTP-binding protein [unclassified Oceanobacter]|jgi:signal recognition particle receptor subunit beta|uniref:GTP-binding protein n=1 Tax=unclassified Oceanobacter TaxID=2620260 RepID=UPI0026E30D22|nr:MULTISPECIES: ATP/GTP-binding protein [unclassified Oceanobacter]MDO6683218.1 ATP/GTP-binding protein [Oceanobacter sp. 5_MG-2023]MDP2506183.1 ATP/GTP-binding protein [Oceanobacter sp. 3_MG-2023]MDP2547276.1 ATP/GTP-binding protein [Oceanobacter sp. 4_MG-2023]MDP2607400.1 ATP/GTP-binding protein [Oceanobacter sp. 1_MG-2023]MDP2610668.1 ATP/GTP-binding protein [Oceanobacter sp. 2_MG-2023]
MDYKIIFGGQVGAGKTTAIAAISDVPVVKTEAKASDDVALRKDTTTVAMDYGLINLPGGEKVHLFGTPGQTRFSFMWDVLTVGGLGLVLLIDNVSENPIDDMVVYIDAFRKFIDNNALVVGITRMDISATPPLSAYINKLQEMGINAPVYEVDARKSEDVEVMLMSMLSILELGLK